MQQPTRLGAAMVPHALPGKHSDGGGLTLVVKPSGRHACFGGRCVGGDQDGDGAIVGR